MLFIIIMWLALDVIMRYGSLFIVKKVVFSK